MAGPGALRIKVREPDGQEREVSFTQEVITIGRSHECDLPLESGFISRNHARMTHVSGGWQIVDEGSKNGVFVNGQRIAGSTAVKAGDALRIGDFRVAVLADAPEEPEPVELDVDRTLVINPAMLNDQGRPAIPPAAGASLPPVETMTTREQAGAPSPQQPPAPERAPAAAQSAGLSHAIAEPAPAAPTTGERRNAPSEPARLSNTVEAPATAAPAAAPPGETAEKITSGGKTGLAVDAGKRTVHLDGQDQTAQLSSREIDLLIALAGAGDGGSGGEELADRVWGSGGGDAEMLERLLNRLNTRLGRRAIEQLPGGGWRLRRSE